MDLVIQNDHNEFRRFLLTLARHDVDFVLCGGVAVILHGVDRRVTNDVDACVRMDRDNLTRLIEAARELDLRPRVPEPLDAILDEEKRRQWIFLKQARVFTLVSTKHPMQLDVFLQYPIRYDLLRNEADAFFVEGQTIRVSNKRHLIEAKSQVQPPRRTDLYDITRLQELLDRERTSET